METNISNTHIIIVIVIKVNFRKKMQSDQVFKETIPILIKNINL
jgi:hypothetical protein